MKFLVSLFIILGSIYGVMFGLFFIAVCSRTKYGKQLRYEIYKIVEMGRKHE